MAKKYIYNFKEAHGLGKELLGGKGAGLAEMTSIGVPIPQGFTIKTSMFTLQKLKKKLERTSVVTTIHFSSQFARVQECQCQA